MTTPPLRLLIDTDPGVDDAIALLMALRHPEAQVEAITVVAGNVGLENTVRNARYLVELCEADVPVYAGAGHALLREARRAAAVHGDDGLGNLGLRPRDAGGTAGVAGTAGTAQGPASGHDPAMGAAPGHAADALIDRIMRNPGALTLVTLGPLTNVALALLKEPRIAALVRGVVMMGGAATTAGNVTPAAEFNVWADPEAARIVFRAGMPLVMVGIEICRGPARWTADEITELETIDTERARVAAALLRYSLDTSRGRLLPGEPPGAGVPDGTAMAVALDPAALTESGRYHVDVETHGELTTGETVVDRRGVLGRPPTATVAHAIDIARFKELVRAACR